MHTEILPPRRLKYFLRAVDQQLEYFVFSWPQPTLSSFRRRNVRILRQLGEDKATQSLECIRGCHDEHPERLPCKPTGIARWQGGPSSSGKTSFTEAGSRSPAHLLAFGALIHLVGISAHGGTVTQPRSRTSLALPRTPTDPPRRPRFTNLLYLTCPHNEWDSRRSGKATPEETDRGSCRREGQQTHKRVRRRRRRGRRRGGTEQRRLRQQPRRRHQHQPRGSAEPAPRG